MDKEAFLAYIDGILDIKNREKDVV